MYKVYMTLFNCLPGNRIIIVQNHQDMMAGPQLMSR